MIPKFSLANKLALLALLALVLVVSAASARRPYRVKLGWDPSIGGVPPLVYVIYARLSNSTIPIIAGTSSTTSITIYLTNKGPWLLTVSARDSIGRESEQSSAVSAEWESRSIDTPAWK